MSREAIRQTVVRRFNEEMGWSCKDYESLKNKDIEDYAQANAVVDSLRICDPAVGSGHFLVSVLNEIIRTKYDLGILIDGSGKRIKKQDYSIDIENDELLISDEDGNPVSYIPGNQESQRIQETLFNEKRNHRKLPLRCGHQPQRCQYLPPQTMDRTPEKRLLYKRKRLHRTGNLAQHRHQHQGRQLAPAPV